MPSREVSKSLRHLGGRCWVVLSGFARATEGHLHDDAVGAELGLGDLDGGGGRHVDCLVLGFPECSEN